MQNLKSKFRSDLVERCIKFSLEIISKEQEFSKSIAAQVIYKQLVRSATSIGANIIEGKAASSRLEFKKFY
jgi:four helix bundle protein